MAFTADQSTPSDDLQIVVKTLQFAARKSAVSGNTLLHLSVMLANMALEDLDDDFERLAAIEIFKLMKSKQVRSARRSDDYMRRPSAPQWTGAQLSLPSTSAQLG